MKSEKAFDCLKMKDDIQASLSKKWAGLTDDEIRERMYRELDSAEDVVAQWWRSIGQTEQAVERVLPTK
jgi:hypothetical protein